MALIALLTAAIQGSNNSENANIDKETLIIRTTEVQRYASELERAVLYIVGQNGVSESDVRFAHPDAHSDYGDLSADADPTDQVFHRDGGAANYRDPPTGVNDGSAWEFYGSTDLPGIATGRADLVAVLPNVTQAFCDRINELNGQTGTPEDTGTTATSGANAGSCIYGSALGRFDDAQQFYATANTVDETTFEQDSAISAAHAAPQACVVCEIDSSNHFYHVLLAR